MEIGQVLPGQHTVTASDLSDSGRRELPNRYLPIIQTAGTLNFEISTEPSKGLALLNPDA